MEKVILVRIALCGPSDVEEEIDIAKRVIRSLSDRETARRIAALLALHPALDANYRAVAGDTHAFGSKST